MNDRLRVKQANWNVLFRANSDVNKEQEKRQ